MTNPKTAHDPNLLSGALPPSPAGFKTSDAHIDLTKDGNPSIVGVLSAASTELKFIMGRFQQDLKGASAQAAMNLYFPNEQKLRDVRALVADLELLTTKHSAPGDLEPRFSDTQIRQQNLLEDARLGALSSLGSNSSTAPFSALADIFAEAASAARIVGVQKANEHTEQMSSALAKSNKSEEGLSLFGSGIDLKASFNDATLFIAIEQRIRLVIKSE